MNLRINYKSDGREGILYFSFMLSSKRLCIITNLDSNTIRLVRNLFREIGEKEVAG
jgi:hypothetical protein